MSSDALIEDWNFCDVERVILVALADDLLGLKLRDVVHFQGSS